MLRQLRSLLPVCVVGLGLSSLASATSIFIFPAYGPANTLGGFVSTYASAFEQNAVQAMMNAAAPGDVSGLPSNTGNINDPGYYQAITSCDTTCNLTNVSNGMITTTDGTANSYNSWMGNTTPTGNFSGEFGNALYFSVAVYSATPFNPDTITFDNQIFGLSTDLSGVQYGSTAGASSYATGCLGTMSSGVCTGTLYTSGLPDGATNNVNYFFYSGFVLYDIPNPMSPGQANLDAQALLGLTIDGTYSLPQATPEPGTLLLFGCGLAGAALWRKRQRS